MIENRNESATDADLTKADAEVRAIPSVAARLRSLLAFALAVAIGLGVHLLISKKEPRVETLAYTIFLSSVLFIALLTVPAQLLWSGLRSWRQNIHPILAAAALFLCLWEVITTGLRW